jgi:hypothetical protein
VALPQADSRAAGEHRLVRGSRQIQDEVASSQAGTEASAALRDARVKVSAPLPSDASTAAAGSTRPRASAGADIEAHNFKPTRCVSNFNLPQALGVRLAVRRLASYRGNPAALLRSSSTSLQQHQLTSTCSTLVARHCCALRVMQYTSRATLYQYCICRFRASGAPYLYSHQCSYLGGPQCQSHMRSGPAIVIGSDHRSEARKKSHLSRELSKAQRFPDKEQLGPGHYPSSSSARIACCSARAIMSLCACSQECAHICA